MKKIVLAMLAVCVSGPLLAQEAPDAAAQKERPAVEFGRGHEAFAKAHKEQMEKIKAKETQMGKLVNEYNKLKEGKKKDAKRAEIEKEVAAMRDEQLKFKQEQLTKFEERLGAMKEEFTQENTAEGKQEWVTKKTDEVIANEGNLRVLFEPRPGQGPRMGDAKGPHMKHPHKKGFFGRKGPRFGKGKQLPPPPDAELPVERPVEK